MKLSLLLESPQTDKDFRRIANTIYQDILDEIKDLDEDDLGVELLNVRSMMDFEQLSVGDKYFFDVADLLNRNDEYADFVLALVNKPNMDGGVGTMRSTNKRVLYLSVDQFNRKADLEDLTHGDYLEALFSNRQFMKVFVHEYIHIMDDIRSDGHVAGGEARGNWEEYYNSPEEFNAFFQEAVSGLENALESMGEDGRGRILQSFEHFSRAFFSYLQDDFKEAMSQNTRKRLMKRLYSTYDYFLEQYNI